MKAIGLNKPPTLEQQVAGEPVDDYRSGHEQKRESKPHDVNTVGQERHCRPSDGYRQ